MARARAPPPQTRMRRLKKFSSTVRMKTKRVAARPASESTPVSAVTPRPASRAGTA
jgi:hypothetical protein